MSEWKGRDEDQVYLVYGPPMRKQVLKDRRTLIAMIIEHRVERL